MVTSHRAHYCHCLKLKGTVTSAADTLLYSGSAHEPAMSAVLGWVECDPCEWVTIKFLQYVKVNIPYTVFDNIWKGSR